MSDIEKVIVIGAPSGGGKSHLISNIRRGQRAELCKQLGIDDPSSWVYMPANDLAKMNNRNIERLVVHYDFYAQSSSRKGFPNLDLLFSVSSHVTVLTLCVLAETLTDRNRIRLEQNKPQLGGLQKSLSGVRYRYLQKQQAYYQKENTVYDLYAKWFRFITACNPDHHYVLDSDAMDVTTTANLYDAAKNQCSGGTDL